MAGVLSRQHNADELREYFRKACRRNQWKDHSSANTSYKDSSPSRDCNSKCESLGIWTGKPKYKEYCTVKSRINSFKSWPDNKTQNVEELVEAGFAYTGVDDSVRCYYCSIGLKDWPDGACPWKQHVFASPKCGHLIQSKGKGFIRRILGERDDDSGSDIDDSNDVIDTVQLAIQRNENSVMAAREYCSNENIIRMAIKVLINQDFNKTFTAVELVKAIEEVESKSEGSNEVKTDKPESLDDLAEKNRQLKDPISCKICFDALACIISLPCGHMVCCSLCISALTKCAVCRTPVKGTVRALMAL